MRDDSAILSYHYIIVGKQLVNNVKMWLFLRVHKPNHHKANWTRQKVMRLHGNLQFKVFLNVGCFIT